MHTYFITANAQVLLYISVVVEGPFLFHAKQGKTGQVYFYITFHRQRQFNVQYNALKQTENTA